MLDAILGNEYLLLFLLVGAGMAFGRLTVAGIGLGTSGVLFLALAAGHFGYRIPDGVGVVGLLLFAYCVGIGAGNRFFASLKREGLALVKLSVVVVGSGALVTGLLAWALGIPPALAGGLFAGALTSTPALAAANEAVGGAGASDLVVGYGIAYPIGVIAVVLFVQLLPRVLGRGLDDGAENPAQSGGEEEVVTTLVEVRNSNLIGERIASSRLAAFPSCRISRVRRGNQLFPLSYEDRFEEGQVLLLVGKGRELELAVGFLGRRSEEAPLRDAENERRVLLVTSRNVVGRRLGSLQLLKDHGVNLTRVQRLGYEFVPEEETRLEKGDQVTVVGFPDALREFADWVGHRPQGIGETDLISMTVGLSLGIFVGMVPVVFPGGTSFALGLAGGPLLVGILLGHFGKVGGIVGFIPRPTRLLLQEFGLALFLADAGIAGGRGMLETLRVQGLELVGASVLIAVVPLVVAFLVARLVLRLSFLQTLGGSCGAMTSTPALGVIVGRTDSPVPVVSYATAYPVALILMTILAKVLVGLL